MADVRSRPGDTGSEGSKSGRLAPFSKAVHVNIGSEQKATIHKTPPGSRPRTLPPLDPNSPDDLTRIRGIDRALADKLRRTGVTHFDQIAEWSPTDIRSLSAAMTLGRSIYKQNWVEQAARLTRLRQTAGMVTPASLAAEAVGQPAPNPPRSITSLIATAASAIRARLRMNQPGDSASEIDQTPAAAAATPLAAITLLPPRTIDANELAARISTSFRRIGATAGISEASFPERVTPRIGVEEAVREASPEPQPPPAAAPVLESVPAPVSVPVPVPVLQPVQIEAASSDSASEFVAARAPKPPPVAPAPETDIEPAPVAESAPRLPDDLCLISDLPQYVSDRLNALGVTYFSDIASFNADDIAALSIDCSLGERINRECWVEQAAMLATEALTKAARRRSRGELSCLTRYPPEILARDPEAFATLIPSPAVDDSIAATPEVAAEEPSPPAALEPPEPPPTATVNVPAPQLASAISPAASKRPPEPIQLPAVTESAMPAAAVDEPPAFEPQAAIARVIAEPAPAPEPQISTAPPPPAHWRDEHDIDYPEHEEAEVTIRPRTPSLIATSPSPKTSGDGSGEQSSDAARSADPGSLSSKLSHCEAWMDGDPNEHAGYLRHVGEASVDIVPARPAPPVQRQPRQSASPDIAAANAVTDPATGPMSVNRFLKALRGR